MIYLQAGQNNEVYAMCSRNKSLANPYYLFSFKHMLSGETYRVVPYKLPPIVQGYLPEYDIFYMNIDYSIPQSLTGNTTSGSTNVHLQEGDYYLKVYEEINQGLNPQTAYDVVTEEIVRVNPQTPETTTTYGGPDDVFIIYEDD